MSEKRTSRDKKKYFKTEERKVYGKDNVKTVNKGVDKKETQTSAKGKEQPAGKPVGKAGERPNGRSSQRPSGRPADKSFKKREKICPVMDLCGGCQFLDISYEQQLKNKEKQVKELCGSFVKFEPIVGMEDPKYYRNKVHAIFGEDKKHNPVSGKHEERSPYIVPIDSCLLENQQADKIIVSIRGLLKSFKIRPYNEATDYGLLRHALVRVGNVSGEIMVVLVLTSPILPSKNNFVKALLNLHPEITTIVINVNGRETSMVLGEKEQVIYGKGYIEDTLCGKTFRIFPKSFYQVNPVQAEKLYAKAMEYAELKGSETVLDAYCGTGTIGMIAADKAKTVIGVELNGNAVKDARNNAKQNNVKNIEFYQKDAGQFMVQLAEQETKIDLVVMDPPRIGSSEPFINALAALKPKKVVYISCNPETLARDLEQLIKKGYKVEKGACFDMSPWMWHVETVVLISKVR